MPEILIKYTSPKTINILKSLAKYFNFSIIPSKEKKEKTININGVNIVKGNKNIDVKALEKIFTHNNINAKTLRKQAWQKI